MGPAEVLEHTAIIFVTSYVFFVICSWRIVHKINALNEDLIISDECKDMLRDALRYLLLPFPLRRLQKAHDILDRLFEKV